jgi:autotransporter translocation and assembly factor TamB
MENPQSRSDTRLTNASTHPVRRAVGLLAVGLIVAFAGLLVWLSREQTLVAAAATLVDRSHGQIALDRVSGSLLRPIHVEHASFKSGRYEFVLENTTLRWSPLWLFAGVAAFDPVSVERARIVSSAGGNEPVQPPQSLATPIRLRLDRASIDRLTIVRGDTEREIGPLTLDVHAGAKSLAIGIEPAQTPWGRFTVRADIANEPPFTLHGKLDLERTGDRPLAAHVDASGELARIDLRSSLRAQTSIVEANAIVQPFAPQVIERMQARLRTVDPRHLTDGAPAALLDGALDVATEGNVVRGKIEVANAMAGTVDEDRIPLSLVAASVGLQSNGWTLSDLRIGLGSAGELTGSGKLTADAVALNVRGDGVNLRGLHRGLDPTPLTVTFDATGDLTQQRIGLALSQSNRRLVLDGTVDRNTLTVEHARLTAGDAVAEVRGTLGLSPEHAFDVRADLRRFDPSRFGKFRTAQLNGNLSATGTLAPTVRVRADGDLKPSTVVGLPATAHARWRSIGTDDPRIAIDTTGKIGETKFDVRGHLVNPEDLRSLDLTLSLEGRDLGELYTITHLPFPPTQPYRLNGRLRYGDRVWSFSKFSGAVGRSDLSGDFSVDLRPQRPFMRGDLASENLDMRDLSGFVGAKDNTGAPPGQVLPRSEYQLQKLNAADADIHFSGRHIRNEALPLNRMDTHLELRGGVFKLDPLAFRAAGGDIDGTIALDARQSVLSGTADLSGRGLQVNRLAPGVQAVIQSAGTVETRIRLSMRGNSVAALLGSANGDVVAMMNNGAISDLLLRLANLDIANTLLVMARGDRNIPINCMVADFKAQDGVLVPKQFVLDTEHTTVTAEGKIELRNENLALRLVAQPKDGSVFALRGPIQISGTFEKPSIQPELGNAIARAGAAVALAIIAPPAAVIPFVQFGKNQSFDCSTHVADASQFIQREPPRTQ